MTQKILSTFNGEHIEDVFGHLLGNGKVTEVAEQFFPRQGRRVACVSIHSATDDQGVTWYAIADGADGAEVVINGDEAWEVAVEFASHIADDENLWHWAQDSRIPAHQHYLPPDSL